MTTSKQVSLPLAPAPRITKVVPLVSPAMQLAIVRGLIVHADMGKEIFTHACYDYQDKD